MNWIQELLNSSSENCIHCICCRYYSPNITLKFIKIENVGIKCNYPVNLISKIKAAISEINNYKKIQLFINSEGIQILHFHFGHVALNFSKLIGKYGRKCLISLYGFDYEYLPNKHPNIKEEYYRLSKYGAHFAVEGTYSKNLLEKYRIQSKNIIIIQMIFSRSKNIEIQPFGYPIQLTQVATYTEKKGQDILLHALALSKYRNKFKIHFHGEIGDGKYYTNLQKIIQTHNLNNVSLGNKLSISDYIHKIKKSHIVVNLSKRTKLKDTEGGCPVNIKDALTLGKPVFTTSHCDIPETAINGYNAWIAQENNIEDASRVLDQIAFISQSEYNAYCHHSIESTKAKLNSNLTGQQITDAYKLILNESLLA